MKIAEIKEMTTADLANSAQIKAARRDIARLKTVLRQRELNK